MMKTILLLLCLKHRPDILRRLPYVFLINSTFGLTKETKKNRSTY
jgi:hypothetical protein